MFTLYIVDIVFVWYHYIKKGGGHMAYSEAQKLASMKYMAEKTDDIRLRVKAGLKAKYKAEAE